jgi:hypothetical protein
MRLILAAVCHPRPLPYREHRCSNRVAQMERTLKTLINEVERLRDKIRS